MSKFYFENQGNGTYLVYPVGPDEQVDALTLGMLTNNSIKNFIHNRMRKNISNIM